MGPNQKAPRFNQRYSKDDDIILVSTDDISFKIQSYILKCHSSVFRYMLSDASLALNPSPVPMDAHSSDLTLLLDLMREDNPDMTNDWQQCRRVLDLCYKYQCRIVVDRFRLRLKPLAAQAPWDMFCMASHCDDVSLAKKALKAMESDKVDRELSISRMPLQKARHATLPYLLGLFVSMDKVSTSRYDDGYPPTGYIPWRQVGQNFKPVV
ncbi:hypothetical protein I317_06889 [Kwoniella heveanensis CBS 569]|uniref:BTB domain-containing protein n=1 Tax=Kwoniella heveanensis BCC8398 TaxID=1296120 RepID=A0A1B9GYS8_9TREE|nr:hypothetical protein I316_01997 [Kwoniella heveanensis BCC8398]OCF39307.1 hypothetical protein I317_06889 [Kwoniella heveanensis CBS 569]